MNYRLWATMVSSTPQLSWSIPWRCWSEVPLLFTFVAPLVTPSGRQMRMMREGRKDEKRDDWDEPLFSRRWIGWGHQTDWDVYCKQGDPPQPRFGSMFPSMSLLAVGCFLGGLPSLNTTPSTNFPGEVLEESHGSQWDGWSLVTVLERPSKYLGDRGDSRGIGFAWWESSGRVVLSSCSLVPSLQAYCGVLIVSCPL